MCDTTDDYSADWKQPIRRALQNMMCNRLLSGLLRGLSQRGFLPHAIWSRLPVNGIFAVHEGGRDLFQYESATGDQIGRNVYWRGLKDFESETCGVFRKLCTDATLVLDVGANTGMFTLLACVANSRLHVMSFEPVPRIFSRLTNNIRLNGFESRCVPQNLALSDAVGEARFHIPFGETPTSASLHAEGYRGAPGSFMNVPVSTIDALVPPGTRVDVAKIDVEGFEDKVLSGMRRVLAESRPSIIVECNPDGPIESVEAILREFDYKFYHLKSGGPVAVDRIIPDKQERYRNFLCVCNNSGAEKDGLCAQTQEVHS